MFSKVLSLLLGLLFIWTTSSSAQTIRYVSAAGTNADPTTAVSWATSTTNLQGAINSLSATGGEVWVAAGTYKPTTTTDRMISFSLRNGVTIYGGFPASGNPGLAERSPASFTTTLSGDIGLANSTDDNSYHVIYNPSSLSLTTTAIIDGFVVTAGNADGIAKLNDNGITVYDYNAGGMYNDGSNGSICSPTIRNCNFINNIGADGGGVFNTASSGGTSSPAFTNCNFINNSSTYGFGGMNNTGGYNAKEGTCNPVLTNCKFTNNAARSVGGGLFNLYSNPQLIDCVFTENVAGARGESAGGGIYNYQSSARLINCKFINNVAVWSGGGICTFGDTSNPVLIGCSFVGNRAIGGTGRAIYNDRGNIKFINCSFSGNIEETSNRAIHNTSVGGTIQLTNCILWNNGGNKTFSGTSLTVSYSLLEPMVTGYSSLTGNLTTTTSPFVSDTDLRLKAGSLAINAGSTTAYSAASGPAMDLAGNVRVQGLIDMGAYESSYVPDLIPILYTLPATQYGTTDFSVVMDLFELNSVPTKGLATIYITKDPLVSLSFDGASTFVGGKIVQNGAWTFDGISNDNVYILTTAQAVSAGSKTSFGLTGVLRPSNTKGSLTITTAVSSETGEEVKIINNIDADKIDYFNK